MIVAAPVFGIAVFADDGNWVKALREALRAYGGVTGNLSNHTRGV